MGSFWVASHRNQKLATIRTATTRDVAGRCRPTNLKPEAQATSRNPAMTSETQGLSGIVMPAKWDKRRGGASVLYIDKRLYSWFHIFMHQTLQALGEPSRLAI